MSFDEQEPPTRIERAQDVLIILIFFVGPFVIGVTLLAFVFDLFWGTR